jgi:hypothetical protein
LAELVVETPLANLSPAVKPLPAGEGAIVRPFSALTPAAVGIDPADVTAPAVVIE